MYRGRGRGGWKRGGGRENQNPYNDTRDWRKRVYQDTMKIFKEGLYVNEKNEHQLLPRDELLKEVNANVYIKDPSMYFPEVVSDELTGTRDRHYDPDRHRRGGKGQQKDIRSFFKNADLGERVDPKKDADQMEEDKDEEEKGAATKSYPALDSLKGKHSTSVEVIEGDCLETAIMLQSSGMNPVVLNMASCWKPGGGVANGAGAQEENMFRRTNYFMHLVENDRISDLYPTPHFAGIYSPNVCTIKTGEDKKYALLDEPKFMSFIAVAALKSPELDFSSASKEARYLPDNKEIMKGKIRTILTLAAIHGHDCPVLSAFGCGAYHNPAKAVAKLFQEVIEEDFSGVFRHVVFSIIEDHNSRSRLNPKGNVAPFAEVFECSVSKFAERFTSAQFILFQPQWKKKEFLDKNFFSLLEMPRTKENEVYNGQNPLSLRGHHLEAKDLLFASS